MKELLRMGGVRRTLRFPSVFSRHFCRGFFGLACAAGLSFAPTWAADIIVNRVQDSGVGSLRQGLVGIQAGDRLVFQPNLNGDTLSNNGTALNLPVAATLFDGNTITLVDPHTWNLSAPLTVDWAGTLTMNGILENGTAAGSLVKSGLGTLILTRDNGYTGGTTLNGGTVEITNSGAFGSGAITVADTVGTSTLLLGKSMDLTNALSLKGRLNLQSAGTINQLSGVISGTVATANLNIQSGERWILSGTNTFTGGVTVANATTIDLTNSAGLGTGTLTNSAATTLNLSKGLTVANKVTLGSNLTVDVAKGSATMSGAIGESVASELIKTGAGTLILSGANTYTGGTIVQQGVLQGDSTSLVGTIADDTSVVFNQTSSGTFAGTILGPGTLSKIGAGTLVFGGTSTLSSVALIKAGELQVTGSISGPVDVVSSASTLSGTGSVGTVTNNGIVQPGTATIGNLTVNGNYTQTSDGVLQIRANSAGNTPGVNNDHLTISGTAKLGGTLHVLPTGAGPFSTATQYTLLDATGGVSGQFGLASSSLLGYGVVVSYDPNDVTFHLQQTTAFRPVAMTGNQFAVGSALDNIATTTTGSLYDMINALGVQSPAAQQQAMAQMSGDIFGNLQTIGLQVGDQFQQLVTKTLVSNVEFLAGRSNTWGDQDIPRNPLGRGWMQGFGVGGTIQNDGNSAGANYNQGGALLGIDLAQDESGCVGVAGGSSYVGIEDGTNSRGQLISYQVGSYALGRGDRGYILGTTNYGYNSYSTNRDVYTAGLNQALHANFGGNQWGANVEGGLYLSFGPINVQPLIGLQYLYLSQEQFQESGGPAALDVNRTGANSVRMNAGARVLLDPWVGPNGVIWTPFTTVRLIEELAQNNRLINAGFVGAPLAGGFTTQGVQIGRSYGALSQGLEIRFSPLWSLYGSADVIAGGKLTAVSGSAALMTRW